MKVIDELQTIRLDHDWTWDELSASMATAGLFIPARTLHYLVHGDHVPRETTLHKIRRYVAAQQATDQADAKQRGERERGRRDSLIGGRE